MGTIKRKGGSGDGAGAKGAVTETIPSVKESLTISRKELYVCEPVVGESNRLSSLEVGIPGEDCVNVLFGTLNENELKLKHPELCSLARVL